jgi:hypothetical protein
MTQSPLLRKTVKLPDSVHQRLNMYALAASAAGVGMLALTQPAEAKIVYTKTHHVIGRNSSFALDLNHDGTIDFQIGYYYRRGTSGFLASIRALPASRKGNQIEGTTAPYRFLAAALKPGARIPNRRKFSASNAIMVHFCGSSLCTHSTTRGPLSGNWINVTNRYLGLKFLIKGKVHYGWARLNETVTGKPIIAGNTHGPDDTEQPAPASMTRPAEKPATLGMLAVGALGLCTWRREAIGAN